jgi:RNA polymerase sigma factor for flagellar operon FliA
MSSLARKLRELKDYRNPADPRSRNRIIEEYTSLVEFIARKIAGRLPASVDLNDLISCGVIGLMDAITKFDSKRDNKFKTYAEFRIRGAILDELRAQDWIPRSVREKAKMVDRAYAKLEGEHGRAITDEEMCQALDVNQEEFHDLLDQVKSVSVLNIDDASAFSKGDRKLMVGLLENKRTSNPFSCVNYKKSQERIREGIKALPEKQRLVLSLYYYEDLNLKEIGQVLDVTESRVSQLHTQAVIKLKAKLRRDFDCAEDIAI